MRDATLRKRLRFVLLLVLVFTLVSALNYSLLLLARTPRYAEEVRLKKSLGAGSARLLAELMVGPAITVGAGLAAAALDTVEGEYEPGFSEHFAESRLARYARSHDNLMLTPHIGGSTLDAWTETERFVIDKAVRSLSLSAST